MRQSLLSHGKNRDICILEGVMGYYDGIAGISKEASAWDVADATDTPAILILNCKGVSVSAVAVVKGFLEYETEHHIKGVILNCISPMMYARMKQMIEEQLKVRVIWIRSGCIRMCSGKQISGFADSGRSRENR